MGELDKLTCSVAHRATIPSRRSARGSDVEARRSTYALAIGDGGSLMASK